jgi:hypothetical protein
MAQMEDLILRIKDAGIRISLVGDQLKLDVAENSDSEGILLEVKRNKPDLVSYIRQAYAMGDDLSGRPQPVEKKETYELCHQQKKEFIRFLILGPHAFNLSFLLSFTNLDESALELALSALIARHESLRTSFIQKSGRLLQRIHDSKRVRPHIRRIDLRNRADKKQQGRELLNDARKRQFDFDQPLLPDLLLAHYSEEEHFLLLTIHHTVVDALSGEVLKKEIYSLYNSYITGEPASLFPMPLQYRDYACWLNSYLAGPASGAARAFYRRTIQESINLERHANGLFQPVVCHPELPSYRKTLREELIRALGSGDEDKYPDAYGTITNLYPEAGGHYRTFLSGEIFGQIKNRSLGKNISLFNVFIAAFAILVGIERATRHVRLYVPFSTRVFEEFEPIVGWLTSEIIVCISFDPDQTVGEFLNSVNELVLEASRHRWFPHEKILADLDISLPVLTHALFNYIDESDTALEDFSSAHSSEGSGHFDLQCRITGHSDGVDIETDYIRRIYTPDRVEKMTGKFAAILEYISASQEETLSNILTCAW